ncbi:MAG: MaoC family dehydratase [Acidobacteriia bacterium]|nr:MaoC family dehydratase [Terriglobia bacterium]
MSPTASKSVIGNFFEDFSVGQEIVHATPRTATRGDAALFIALTGSRYVLHSSDAFARAVGYREAPIDDLLTFHFVLGKTVPDISLNAIANLGYAGCRFGVPVYAGDTLRSRSTVIGLKENSDGKTGIVYVRSTGFNQRDEIVLDYFRWVMVRKRDLSRPAPAAVVPDLPPRVPISELIVPKGLDLSAYDTALAGSPALWDDYQPGERIDHMDGMTFEEAEHMMATRLYQNTARVHFNQHVEKQGRFGKRIVYGGHIISLARAHSFNGLANAFRIAAINGGRHTAPSFAGDTIYAWSAVIEKSEIPGRDDVGALRLRTIATKDRPCADFPYQRESADGKRDYDPAVVLDLDYTVLMPRRIEKRVAKKPAKSSAQKTLKNETKTAAKTGAGKKSSRGR